MSELKINYLPREILAKVFRLLDVVNLKNATLTCKLWNKLIQSTCRWSLTLSYKNSGKLSCTRNGEQKMDFIMKTKRKFETIKIWGCRLSENSPIHSLFQRHGFNVVELTLDHCRVYNLTTVAELLNLTPNLNRLHINLNICDTVSSDTHLGQISSELKKLKSLDMCVNDQRIRQYFRKTKLTTATISEGLHSTQHGSLVDFILSQNTLTSLAVDINNTSLSILVELGKMNATFQLTKLAITGAVDDHANLLRFVNSQAKNLRELEVGSNFLSLFCKCIIESMPKLKTLGVVACTRLTDDIANDFDEILEMNCSVRTIKLLGRIDNDLRIQFIGKLLQQFLNVRRLIYPHSGSINKIPSIMARSLGEVESIAVGLYKDEHFFHGAKFSNLTRLHIQHLCVKIDWNEFTKSHSRLAELIIEEMKKSAFLTSDDIDQMTTNVELQNIRLGVGFVVDDRFFEIIQTMCTKLKVLDLHKSCLPHGLNCNVEINVLRLCDDIKCSKTFRSMLRNDIMQ